MRTFVYPAALAVLAAAVASGVRAGTVYGWKADASGSYGGLFSDSAHWNPAIDGGPGSGYPQSENFGDTASFPRIDADYTVTLPEGVVTNLSTPRFYVQYGRKITVDGSKTTWVMPTVSGNTYGKLEIYAGGLNPNGTVKAGPMCFKRYGNDGKETGLGTFSNFTLTVQSAWGGEPGTRVELTGQNHWTDGSLRMFVDANEADGLVEFRFKDGYTPSLPVLQLGFANKTNIITFSDYDIDTGGGLSYVPYAGALANGVEGLFELNVLDGSVLDMSGSLSFGYSYNNTLYSNGKTFRLNVADGSTAAFSTLYASSKGRHEIDVKGAGSKLMFSNAGAIPAVANGTDATGSFKVTDGASLQCNAGLVLGGDSAEKAGSEVEFLLSGSSAVFARAFTLNMGEVTLLDGAELVFTEGDSNSSFKGGGVDGAQASLYADGAIVRFRQGQTSSAASATRAVLNSFTTAAIGAGGLVLSAEWKWNYEVSQNFTDWETPGTLTAIGYSTDIPLVLSGDDSRQSYLAVAGGAVRLAAGASHYSHVIVTNDAVFSIAAGDAVRFKSLVLGDGNSRGTLVLENGTVVSVDGALDLTNGSIAFTQTLGDGTNTVFRRASAPSEAEIEQWEIFYRSVVSSGLPEDGYVKAEISEADGEWRYLIVVAGERTEKAGDVSWSGGASGWGDALGWAGGVFPSETLGAVFSGSDAIDVAVDGDVSAASITMSSTAGTTLSGGRICLSDNVDAAIEVEAGENEIASMVQLVSRIAMPVEEGASLLLSGEIVGGGFTKSGGGRLVVANPANRMIGGFGLSGGWLEFTSTGAMGYLGSSIVSDLVSGTFEYTGPAGESRTKTVLSGPVVFKPESDLVMPLPSAVAGAIIKRGAGDLVFKADSDAVLALAASEGHESYSAGDVVTYPADGSAPSEYNALTVAEGEFILRGEGDDVPSVTFGSGQSLVVGVPTAQHSGETARQPGLVVDHAKLTASKINIGSAITAGESFVAEPYIVVTNGGVLSATINANYQNTQIKGVRVFADNGVLSGAHALNVLDNLATTNYYELRNGSVMVGIRMTFHGSTVMKFDSSVLAYGYDPSDRSKLAACQLVNYSVKPQALTDWSFVNGSILACGELEYSVPSYSRSNPHTLRFDDSEWWTSKTEQYFATSSLNVTSVVSGVGLRQAPEAGQTFTWITPVVGEGGFVKEGEGTVVFAPQMRYHALVAGDPVTLGYSGLTDIRAGLFKADPAAVRGIPGRRFRVAGTLDMSGGALASPVFVAAGGVVSNTAASRPTVCVDPSGNAPVTFDFANAFSSTGRWRIDFGRTGDDEPLAEDAVYTVGLWTGGVKPAVKARVVNAGKGRSGVFSVNDDGTMSVTITRKRELTIIVR